jgi:hypothetical protein
MPISIDKHSPILTNTRFFYCIIIFLILFLQIQKIDQLGNKHLTLLSKFLIVFIYHFATIIMNLFNLFIMNRIQTMSYLSIMNSCKMTNAMGLLHNINSCANNFTSEIIENETTGKYILI